MNALEKYNSYTPEKKAQVERALQALKELLSKKP